MNDKKVELIDFLRQNAVLQKEITLSSGMKSNFYIDGRIATLSSRGNFLIATLLLQKIKQHTISAIGGLTLGADPIVGGVCALASINQLTLKGFLVRKELKAHGTQKQIEGPALYETDRIAIVDDVATTGGSLIRALDVLQSIGLYPVISFVVVDRNQGARELLAERGCTLEALVSLPELGL